MNKTTRKLVLSALFLAIGLLLPFLTGQIKEIGNLLLPMHLPVFLCGLICGWPYGLAVGFIVPLMRSALFGMPPMFPTATAMAFELATYGAAIGLLYGRSAKQGIRQVYLSLVAAMVAGRAVWGLVMAALMGLSGGTMTMQVFLAGALLNAIPGIILQLVLIPTVMAALDRTGVVKFRKTPDQVKNG